MIVDMQKKGTGIFKNRVQYDSLFLAWCKLLVNDIFVGRLKCYT